MSTLDPEDRVVLQLYREALAMKEQGTDLSKPGVAKAMLSIIPDESRQAFRMMVVLMRMDPSVESPEWGSMPAGFWDSD